MSQSYATVSATTGSTSSPDLSVIDEDTENPSIETTKAVGGFLDSLHDDPGGSDAPRDDQASDGSSKGSWKVTWKGEEEEINFLWPENSKERLGLYEGGFERVQGMSASARKESMLSLESLQDGTCKPLKVWYRNLVIRQACHSHMADSYISKDTYFNTISVAVTALSSCAIFISLVPSAVGADAVGIRVPLIGPYNALALIAGVLAACNTVLQAILKTKAYNRKGENHRSAFKQYTKMRFKMENLIGDRRSYYHHNEIDEKLLDGWIEKYEELLETEPIIPQDVLEWISEKEDNAGLHWTRHTMDFD